MLTFLLNAILALGTALLQVSFLSRLPGLFSNLPLVTAVAAWLIVKDRQAEAAAWLLLGGLVFDLHGPYGFGTELALAGAAYLVMRFLFVRVFSNDSYAAVFLLAGAGALTRFVGLAGFDGVRVLFGNEPYFLVWESNLVVLPMLAVLTAGAAAVIIAAVANLVERWLEKMFLSSRSKLKL
jgi:hypothetical protein